MIMTTQDWNSLLAVFLLFCSTGGLYLYVDRSSIKRRRHAR